MKIQQNKSWVATADKFPRSLRSVSPTPPRHHLGRSLKKMITRVVAAFFAIGLIACQSTAHKVATFPTPKDLAATEQAQNALKKASTDIKRIQNRKDPLYAKFQTALYDGGTRFYIGDGYRITDHRKMSSRNGELGRIVGQTVIFDSKITGGQPIEYSDAGFELTPDLRPAER